MMDNNCEPASSLESGELGALHIKRLWSKTLINSSGSFANWPDEWELDKMTIFALGLSLEETHQYLATWRPSFEQFQQWILEKNCGRLDPRKISRLNSTIKREPHDEDIQKWLDQIEAAPPVLDDEDLAFWEENGYVILRDAVSVENFRVAETAVWEHLQMDADDPDTWYNSPTANRHGIMIQFFHHHALQANRDSLRIHKAYAQLWRTADLWCTIDRVSFNPPERRNWRFPGPKLHWDTLLQPPVEFGMQGILYLSDTTAEQGAFTCVAGFHKRIDDWLRNLPPGVDPQKQDLESLGPIPIAANAGDLIIWQEALPHGSSPNTSTRPRIAQYIKMFPAVSGQS